MTKHKQLNRHDPENNIYGDCWRTCIACILDKHPSEVPHFLDESKAKIKTGEEIKKCSRWLRKHDITRMAIPISSPSLREAMEFVSKWNPHMHFILAGQSKNEVNHCVICQDGKIVFDPSQDESGVVGPCADDGCYWIEIFSKEVL